MAQTQGTRRKVCYYYDGEPRPGGGGGAWPADGESEAEEIGERRLGAGERLREEAERRSRLREEAEAERGRAGEARGGVGGEILTESERESLSGTPGGEADGDDCKDGFPC